MYKVKEVFANNIKRLRKNRQLTQEQFAELINMQWKSVVNFESGRNLASPQNLETICTKLNIAPCELFWTFDSENEELVDKINILLNKADNNKLIDIYKIVAILVDDNHFVE